MRILTISFALVFLSGCSTNCFEKAAMAQLTIPVAYQATGDALENELISKGAATEALTVIDGARATANEAGALCAVDEKTALDYIGSVNKSIAEVSIIIKENKEM